MTLFIFVGEAGFEPTTHGLSCRCSTNWAIPSFVWKVGFDPTTFWFTTRRSPYWATFTVLWRRRVTIPFLRIFSPPQWPHLPLLLLGVWRVTIPLSSLSQSDGSTIFPSHTIYKQKNPNFSVRVLKFLLSFFRFILHKIHHLNLSNTILVPNPGF